MGDANKRIEKLREELDRHNRLYYVEARPEISDREYDKLMAELIALEAAHPELVTPDSPTQRVGGDPQESLKPVRHARPMMSIDNTYSEDEVRAFDERVRKLLGGGEDVRYVLEPKIDGTAVSLRYERGVLVLAATRGRGNVGDDVTANARTIHAIPLRLRDGGVPAVLEVRGEVYMNNEDFQRGNKEIEAEGEEAYANPRNLTAGTLRRLDPRIVAKRRLRFLSHGLGEVRPEESGSYWDWIKLLQKWGLPVPANITIVKDVDEALKVIKEFETARRTLPYMTDGMVMKVDSFAQRTKLGATSKAPRWVMAYKYEAEQQPTVLKDVRWQVGKGGNLTPVADLEPVFIGGVTVTHATLHNIEQIQRLDLHLGDTIVLERAGEVIPYVVEAGKDKRPGGAKPAKAPAKCPACGTPVAHDAEAVALRCPNRDCPAQVKERLRWFAGRSQLDIEGMGDWLVEQLVANGKLKDFADIYRLTAEDIAPLTREVQTKGKTVIQKVGEKTAAKVTESIEASKARGLGRVLGGLGIRHVGTSNARQLAQWAGTIDRLTEASVDELRDALAKDPGAERADEQRTRDQVARLYASLHPTKGGTLFDDGASPTGTTRQYLEKYNVGRKAGEKLSKAKGEKLIACFPTVPDLQSAGELELLDTLMEGRAVARSVHEFLHSDYGQKVIAELKAVGVKLEEPRASAARAPTEWTGKTVVITGSFERFTREELAGRLRDLGAKVADSVSKNTDLLLMGANAGSKYDRAKALGFGDDRIWDEAKVLKHLPEK